MFKLLLAGWLLLAASAQAQEAGGYAFVVNEVRVSLRDEMYLLDLSIDFDLSAEARQALRSGVPLEFVVTVELERPRSWWLDEKVNSLARRYRLRFHALSERYLLTDLVSGETRSFLGEGSALSALGELRELPLVARKALRPGASYEIWVKAELDIDALPAPLRTAAYLSPQWRLVSEWTVWPLDV